MLAGLLCPRGRRCLSKDAGFATARQSRSITSILPENGCFINRRLHTPTQSRHVDRVIVVHFVTPHTIIITDTVAHAHRHLDGVRPICPSVIVPLPPAGIQLTTIQRQDCAIGSRRCGRPALCDQNTHLLVRPGHRTTSGQRGNRSGQTAYGLRVEIRLDPCRHIEGQTRRRGSLDHYDLWFGCCCCCGSSPCLLNQRPLAPEPDSCDCRNYNNRYNRHHRPICTDESPRTLLGHLYWLATFLRANSPISFPTTDSRCSQSAGSL